MGRILVVDDTSSIRELTARCCSRDGHDVREASMDRRRLATLAEWPADLIVLDYAMPGMTGLEVLEHVRRAPYCARTGVIMVSASDEVQVMRSADELGARQYLVKSKFTLADLQRAIGMELPPDRFRHVVFPAERRVTYRSTLMRMKIDELQAKITARQAGIVARLRRCRPSQSSDVHSVPVLP